MAFTSGSSTSTEIKICGIKEIAQAKAISNMGVDAIGVIGVKGSPRFVDEEQRRNLFSELKTFSPTLKRVWVIADLDNAELASALSGDGIPSVIQLHGNESLNRCSQLRQEYPEIEWWKALRIRKKSDFLLAQAYTGYIDKLLLDAWSPRELGGSGLRIPLEWIKQAEINLPWWLAGGISAEWIPEVLSKVKPFGIDASSRLEISPGLKDLEKVNSLIKAVKKSK